MQNVIPSKLLHVLAAIVESSKKIARDTWLDMRFRALMLAKIMSAPHDEQLTHGLQSYVFLAREHISAEWQVMAHTYSVLCRERCVPPPMRASSLVAAWQAWACLFSNIPYRGDRTAKFCR
jgi:hypothetical protein